MNLLLTVFVVFFGILAVHGAEESPEDQFGAGSGSAVLFFGDGDETGIREESSESKEVDEPKEPVCGPVCMMFCENGNVLDENGCPICKCKESPEASTQASSEESPKESTQASSEESAEDAAPVTQVPACKGQQVMCTKELQASGMNCAIGSCQPAPVKMDKENEEKQETAGSMEEPASQEGSAEEDLLTFTKKIMGPAKLTWGMYSKLPDDAQATVVDALKKVITEKLDSEAGDIQVGAAVENAGGVEFPVTIIARTPAQAKAIQAKLKDTTGMDMSALLKAALPKIPGYGDAGKALALSSSNTLLASLVAAVMFAQI